MPLVGPSSDTLERLGPRAVQPPPLGRPRDPPVNVAFRFSDQEALFSKHIAGVLAAGTLLALASLALTVWMIGTIGNERAAAHSMQLVASRIAEHQRALGGVADRYSTWADARDALARAGDLPWLRADNTVSAEDAAVFDGLVYLGGPFPEPVAWRATDPHAGPSPSFLPADVTTRIEEQLARQELGADEAVDLVVVLNGQLVLLSAREVRPEGGTGWSTLPPLRGAVAIVVKTFDAGALQAMGDALLLANMHVSRGPGEDAPALHIVSPASDEPAYLSWTPPRPGTEMLAAMAPLLGVTAFAITILGGLASWVARHLMRSESHARRIALHDPLTGLPNRRFFHEHLGRTLSRARTNGQSPSLRVLLLDLDCFKPVNDCYGHQAGDLLLCEVAKRLRQSCPEDSEIVRLGGDEFVVVLEEQAARDNASLVAQRILVEMLKPFSFPEWSATLSCSIGIADWSDGASSSDLLRHADQAMYQAKQAGRATFVHYDDLLGRALQGSPAPEPEPGDAAPLAGHSVSTRTPIPAQDKGFGWMQVAGYHGRSQR